MDTPMRIATRYMITAAVFALVATGDARSPQASPATPGKTPTAQRATPEKTPAVDPKAIDALKRMGAYLRERPAFTVRTTSETDYVLDTGQKATIAASGELRVKRPDKMRAHVTSDRKQREFIFDGKTFTVFSPNLGLYATIPAPGTLREVADMLVTDYGLQLPLVDLFRWGSGEADFDMITDARYVGRAKLDGVDVDQYALRQPGVDWQIWIERGDHPLPRKLLLTTTDDPARPEYRLNLAWELGANQPDSTFTLVAPKGSAKIAMVDLDTMRAQQERQARNERQARRTMRATRGEAK
jgi:hypothetical protein